jgi:dienelactone hydrolase
MRNATRFVASMAILLLAACVTAGKTVQFQSATSPSVTLSGPMTKPEGTGPFPAVILLHGGGGLTEMTFIADLQADLAKAGFATLAVDSWAARNLTPPASYKGGRPGVVYIEAYGDRLIDGYSALRYLQAQAEIDPLRIAVMGFSEGGRVAMYLAAGLGPDNKPYAAGPLPRAAIGYYPSCYGPTGPYAYVESIAANPPNRILPADRGNDLPAVKMPFLAHVAGKDNLPGSRPEICTPVFERLAQSGGPFERFDYPEAHHAFNDQRHGGGRPSLGGTIAYHAESARLAWERTLEFLHRRMDIKTAAN